jgi:class 3 adenylate cyclase
MNDTSGMEDRPADLPSAKPRSHLFRKYALLISTLVSGVLIVGGMVEIYFSYQENKAALLLIQQARAKAAATVISRFAKEIESQVGWTMHAAFLPNEEALEQRKLDFLRLLRQAPEITEVAYVDGSGREQLLMSQRSINVVGSGKDYTGEPKFLMPQNNGRYFSQVYFRRESEPYLTMGLRDHGRQNGVTIAEINLKFVWDVISSIDGGPEGRAFIVDSNGMLIAHPDISMVLRKTDLSTIPQVTAALAADGPGDLGAIAAGMGGHEVLSSHATIAPLGWLVFIESPLSAAFAPLFDSLIRTAVLISAGIVLSIVAGLLLARRIVRPIQVLQQGAGRIGAGALDYHIDVRTGDELEVLADEFNEMTARLRESYNNVERISELKRYFSPQLAELIVSSEGKSLTESHRSEITVVFCDLRNFTKFSSVAEPEQAMRVLEQYFVALGTRLRQFEATIGHFAGDGLMAFFNDPLPCPDHAQRAVRMALAMQQDVGKLIEEWNKRGLDLGFGIGISSGYATLGHIGTADQFHYTAIGSVVNLSSRFCDEASNGQILIGNMVHAEVDDLVEVASLGERALKGFPKPVPILQVVGLKEKSS